MTGTAETKEKAENEEMLVKKSKKSQKWRNQGRWVALQKLPLIGEREKTRTHRDKLSAPNQSHSIKKERGERGKAQNLGPPHGSTGESGHKRRQG